MNVLRNEKTSVSANRTRLVRRTRRHCRDGGCHMNIKHILGTSSSSPSSSFFSLLATKIEIFPEAVECGVVADVAAVPHSFTAIHRKFYIHGDRNYLKLPEGKGFFSNLM